MSAHPEVTYGYKLVVRLDLTNPVMSSVYLLNDDDEEPEGLGIAVGSVALAVAASGAPVLRLDIPVTPETVEVQIID